VFAAVAGPSQSVVKRAVGPVCSLPGVSQISGQVHRGVSQGQGDIHMNRRHATEELLRYSPILPVHILVSFLPQVVIHIHLSLILKPSDSIYRK
jgi:hypothetical protein